MMLVERPGYRIDSRTIKRGSRPSIVIVSFVESSNLCILASLQSSLFLGCYLDFILVFSVLEILPVHPLGKVSPFHPFAQSPLLVSIF